MSIGIIDLSGMRYGRLEVVKYIGTIGKKKSIWLCKCDCGNETRVASSDLRRKGRGTKSCGCIAVERSTKHGYARDNGKMSSEYMAYKNMITRCYNPKYNQFKDYGKRGISVCERWKNGGFLNFIHDMGDKPSPKHSLDRIDNNKGYSKENCHWATKMQQMGNTSANRWYWHDGKQMILADWARLYNLKYMELYCMVERKPFEIVIAGLDLKNQLERINQKYQYT